MSTYYVAQNGLQLGPYTVLEIEEKINSSNLSWQDFIYDDRSQDWLMLMEFAPLTKLFNQSFKTNPIDDRLEKNKAESDSMKRRCWYVLKQKNNYGPFCKTEMIQMLQGRTLTEYDFIWNKNMSAWKKLADVPDFSVEEIRKIFAEKQNFESEQNEKLFFRRKFARAKVNSMAVIHDHKKIYKSVSYEIGAGGVGLIIEEAQFEIGQQIYIHIKPALNVPSFNAICKIVSRRGNQYGVQFIKISAAAKKSICDLTEDFDLKNAG